MFGQEPFHKQKTYRIYKQMTCKSMGTELADTLHISTIPNTTLYMRTAAHFARISMCDTPDVARRMHSRHEYG